MYRLITVVIMWLMLVTPTLGADVYIDPTCGTPGDGSSPTCAGVGTDPYNSWASVTFNAANDYYQKCATTAALGATITVTSIAATSGNHMIIGAYYGAGIKGVSGNRPIIKRTGILGSSIAVTSSDYIDITNIRFEEGERSIWLGTSASYIYIYDCVIGAGAAKYGIQSNTGNNYFIYNNTIDSEILTYGQTPAGSGGNLYDGIIIYNADNCSIYGNTIRDWGHTGIQIESGSDNCLIYNNLITGTNSAYMRGFGIDTGSDSNLVYNNYIKNCNVKNQLGSGDANVISYNIFSGVTRTDSPCLSLEPYPTATDHVTNNKIYNNTFYNCNLAGIYLLRALSTRGNITGNDISNNIISTVIQANKPPIRVIDYGLGGAINTNTFRNNILYDDAATQVLYWTSGAGSNTWTAAQFDASTGTDSNTVSGHTGLDMDPKFTDATGGDLTLLSNSPAIDVGIVLGAAYDDGILNSSIWPSSVSTADQDLTGAGWEIGAYIYAMVVGTPYPENGVSGIPINATATWTNPVGATSVDVMWEVGVNPPTVKVIDDGAVETYNPPADLGYSQTVYWRVDVNHAGGTETGTVWSFTTQSTPPSFATVQHTPSGGMVPERNKAGIDIE